VSTFEETRSCWLFVYSDPHDLRNLKMQKSGAKQKSWFDCFVRELIVEERFLPLQGMNLGEREISRIESAENDTVTVESQYPRVELRYKSD